MQTSAEAGDMFSQLCTSHFIDDAHIQPQPGVLGHVSNVLWVSQPMLTGLRCGLSPT